MLKECLQIVNNNIVVLFDNFRKITKNFTSSPSQGTVERGIYIKAMCFFFTEIVQLTISLIIL